ncbi:hypothetical protein HU200_056631 [Digitaria exilis]|uniref:DUF4220 domain-containing protein n=1 Tax=Digitaria exilis TaxID=1010633 RepID=A0A835AG07_9POAL|nr:hypothetical protein HU200_056631 [Digitaria exilis]
MEILGVSLSHEDHVNEAIIAAAVLSVSLVALSTYGRRLCRHPAVRFFVWGSSIVFLPLTSFIISSLLSTAKKNKACNKDSPEFPQCKPDVQDMWTVLLWTVLIFTIKCNADVAAVAVTTTAASPASGNVSVDGNSISPPLELELVFNYIWTSVLIVFCFPMAEWVENSKKAIFVAFSMLGFAKVVLKLATFSAASGSFSVGKNARLIAGYMAQQLGVTDGDEQVPRYIVMGETKEHVEETPQGCHIKRDVLDDKLSSLITLDRVWRLAQHGDGILAQRQELRDLCLSYSLFKILRRRLSGYPLADAGSEEALNFVLRGMDSVGSGVNVDRVFRVLVDELWFASDFYYSPVPLCTFGGWCAILNYLCSVLIIVVAVAVGVIYVSGHLVNSEYYYYKFVITYSLVIVVMLVEAWEIIAGVRAHAALTAVLRLRPAKRWRDKIGQNSVLEPRRFQRRTGLLSEKLYGRAGLMRSVPVSSAVKDAVHRSLLSRYGDAEVRRAGGKVEGQKCWAWDGYGSSSNTELILTWHVATRLFEMRSTSASPDMTAASHLSNYLAYLVAAAPELLPDSVAWTEKRYREVSEDVRVALGGEDSGGSESTEEMYGWLMEALSAASRDKVLRQGAELGRHLVEKYGEDEASACRNLADFWSEMVLYVAPSENVKGHVQAMARGGEFITLVWALLLHAGVTTRPDMPDGSIP